MLLYTRGMTLIEILIVVAMIGILAGVAYPVYEQHVEDNHRGEAQSALMAFSQAMEREYINNFTYENKATSGASVGAPAPFLFAPEAPVDGDDKYYDLSIVAASQGRYTLRAAPKSAGIMAGDGRLELTSTGQRCWYEGEDNSGGSCTRW